MNKTMAVIIGATTILAVGLMVLAIFNSSIGGLESDLDATSNQGCDYQLEAAENPEDLEDVSENCRPEGSSDKFLLRKDDSVLDAVTGSSNSESGSTS